MTDDVMTVLPPCPFCGDVMELWYHGTHARHVNMDSKCPIRQQAIEVSQWNTRATAAALNTGKETK